MCDASYVNGCKNPGVFSVLQFNRYGRTIESQYSYCCEQCANEDYMEASEGTNQPFPNALNATPQHYIEHYRAEFFDRYIRETL